MDFNNKKVLITGAGSGIGAAAAKQFGKYGAHVLVTDYDLGRANAVASEIGDNADAYELDVSEFSKVEQFVQKMKAQYGHLDILVNNAGIGPSRPSKTADHSLDDWDRVVAVNQSGVFYCMKCVLPVMLEHGAGNIINIASLAGLKASGNNISYSASKFAVVGMTKSAALEYARKNIRINAVCPGYTQTALLDQLKNSKEGLEDVLKKQTPMNRFGEPEEIADTITWLASDQSAFITGQTITIDGGISL